jgi:hypothetical protein
MGEYGPQGDSPERCTDLEGNVSKWTLCSFRPYPHHPQDGREDPEGNAERDPRRLVAQPGAASSRRPPGDERPVVYRQRSRFPVCLRIAEHSVRVGRPYADP